MNATDWLVVLAGATAIGWVNWYFFIAGRTAPAGVMAAYPGASDSTPEITITVDGGYAPNVLRVRAGSAVRLVFDRRDRSSCSEEVVFPDFGIRQFLPTGERTSVELTPPTPGRYEFMCGMSMLRGTLIAE